MSGDVHARFWESPGVRFPRATHLIGPITLDEKCAGARSEGDPHAACEAEGTGNGATDHTRRARSGKPRTLTSVLLRVTAPVLDPTGHSATR